MDKFLPETFFRVGATIEKLRVDWRDDANTDAELQQKLKVYDLALLEIFIEECGKIGLYVASQHLKHLKDELSSKENTTVKRSDLAAKLEFISDTITIEMKRNIFMYLPMERATYYDQKELFGKDVNGKFPGIQYDMTEAGNCYATGRSTACVFHLMRIMETGVQVFGTKLGVSLANEKNWQNILDEINKAIKALPAKDKATIEMSQASANLYAVKLAWRNEVMHPKDTYTLEEADNLIRQVRIFMQQLVTIV